MVREIVNSRIITSRSPAVVSKDLAFRIIGDAWITFVTRTLTTAATLGRLDIADELSRIEESGSIDALRTAHDIEIGRILNELMNLDTKAQVQLCQDADVKLLALALDRVQCTTFKLVELGRPDREPPVDVIQPMLELFHRMLLDEHRFVSSRGKE
jgi:hypothetical protein